MNNHWWRNTRPKVDDEDERTWPKLSHPTVEERSQVVSIQRPRFSRLSQDLASGSEVSNLQEALNETDYPKLGEIVLKRQISFADNSQLEICDVSANAEPRRPRVLRSTDTIHINLHKTLESLQTQRWPLCLQTEQPTRITVDICKLNVNMSVSVPPDCRWPVQKSQRCVAFIGKKKKKPSRNKLLIHYARLMRREYEASKRQISEVRDADGGIDGIDFHRLGINVAPRDEPELVKKMAALSCLSTDYRSPGQVKISEDTVVFRPDVHEKMDNLCLDDGDDCRFEEDGANEVSNGRDAEPIDCDAMEATLSLKDCDESGELKHDIPIKREPDVLGTVGDCRSIRFADEAGLPQRIRKCCLVGETMSTGFCRYCTNTVTPELRKHLEEFLAEIARLQRRMYERDSVKGKSKRRYYAGIKEVQKHIDLKKIKFVVIAPDLEKVEMQGGLDDTLNMLLGTCKKHEVPYCFGLGRRKLGYYTHGNGFASCIGISNYSGAEEKLKNVLLDIVDARNEFARLINDEARIIDLAKVLPKEELILSEVINAYSRILASSS